MARHTGILAAAAGMAIGVAAPVMAENVTWINGAGGPYAAPANWSPAHIPTSADRAIFDLSGTYTVSMLLQTSRSVNQLSVLDDNVTMNLFGATYNVLSTTGSSFVVGGGGRLGGGSNVGQWTLTGGGTFNTQSTAIGGSGVGVSIGSGSVTAGSSVVWNSAGLLVVGSGAPGTLTIQGNADVNAFMSQVGANRAGTATVTGTGSTWIHSASLDIGTDANGTLNVLAGGLVRSQEGTLGFPAGTTGTATVDGPSRWENTANLLIGGNGAGVLNVTGGGYVSSVGGPLGSSIADGSGSTGTVTLSGANSRLTNTGLLNIGRMGAASVTVQGGAWLNPGGSTYLAAHPLGSATVSLSGVNSRWTGGPVYVGGTSGAPAGTATVTIGADAQMTTSLLRIWSTGTVNLNGGTLEIGSLVRSGAFNWPAGTLRYTPQFLVGPTGPLGAALTVGAGKRLEAGQLAVNGAGAVLDLPDGDALSQSDVIVGSTGPGAVNVSAGGTLTSYGFSIGEQTPGNGAVTIAGVGSRWTVGLFPNLQDVFVGRAGTGALTLQGGGAMTVAYNPFMIGNSAGSHGTVTVTGPGSLLDVDVYEITVGRSGDGALTITDGGRVDGSGFVADLPDSDGSLTISGQNAVWNAPVAVIGSSGAADAAMRAAGLLDVGDLYLADRQEGSAAVIVENPGSLIRATAGNGAFGQLIVGGGGSATLTLRAGGRAQVAETFIGDGIQATGEVVVTGAGSQLASSEELAVGYNGHATLRIEAGANATSPVVVIGVNQGAIGDATVQDAGSVLNAGSLAVGASGAASLMVGTAGQVTVQNTATIGSQGTATLGAGGTLSAASLAVNGGGTLRGTGIAAAPVNNAGTVSPGMSTGTLNVQGSYTQAAAGVLAVELAGTAAGAFDRLAVTGAATLGGTLNVSLMPGFNPGPTDSFTILTAASVAGTFSQVNLPPLAGGSLRVVYGPTSVRLVSCYANCDGSTAGSVLNVNDFVCYSQRFAAGSPYADCDLSGTLNVNDFVCFQQRFAAGCP